LDTVYVKERDMPGPKRRGGTAAENRNRAILYRRVSTTEQAEEGVSLATQEEMLRAYCTLRKLEIVAVVTDAGVSGSVPLRDRQGGALVAAAVDTREAGAVVAVRLDRLFRDAADCLAETADWDRNGVALHLVDMGGSSIDTSTSAGRFMLTVLAGVAEMERNRIRERTREAMAHKKARGELVGSVPFGYRLAGDGVRLEPEPAEQETIGKVLELRSSGLAIRTIAQRLNGDGVTARGKRWHPTTIHKLLTRAAGGQQ
jgi:site-specific DNA recombinase